MKRENEFNEFVRLIRAAAGNHDEREVFRDFCHAAASEMIAATTPREKRGEVMARAAAVREKYGDVRFGKLAEALGVVCLSFEQRREDFFGHVYESFNASVRTFGQFFTPTTVSRMMARMAMPKPDRPGKIVKMNDPACGAGALVIEAAEAFVNGGGRQGDLLIYAEDIDLTAAEMAYIQLTLLGYPAVVTHMNTLSREVFGGPWYTVGYILHDIDRRMRIEAMFDLMKSM